jgi:hypothetical protein
MLDGRGPGFNAELRIVARREIKRFLISVSADGNPGKS